MYYLIILLLRVNKFFCFNNADMVKQMSSHVGDLVEDVHHFDFC